MDLIPSELADRPVPRASATREMASLDRLAALCEPDRPATQKKVAVPEATEPGTDNELRPRTFDQIVGQDGVKHTLSLMVKNARQAHAPLDHVLFVGPSGTGKSTFAHVIAGAMGARVFQLSAPISHDTLVALQAIMADGDVLFVDEIHLQAIQERRGSSSATQPEVLFSVMEDRQLPTETGVLPFPKITFIGGTTDEGMLPDAFINRFPIRPRFQPYTEENLTEIARMSAERLGRHIDSAACATFARASRRIPREVNNYVRNARSLTQHGETVTEELAFYVLDELVGCTRDGLTADMQAMLKFLYLRGRRITRGEVRYQASVNTIATAIGKSRDSKAIALRVEPWLIEQGYVQVGHGGRILTDAGVQRAKELT